MKKQNLKNHSMDSNSELMLEVQANSPYNDGWTQQFYREQLEKKQSKTMTKQVDFEKYQKFVDAVTSDASTDFVALSDRLVTLDEKGANIERLLTAGVGINAEGGEFLEIIKKMVFQGKPWDDHNREHLIIELGDLMWYVAQACMALGVSFDDVIARNVTKLEKRYPGGSFDVYYSENRQEGDL
jgi:NTP pyrophosphatase (non-canonical NTP hydrolase)